MDQGSRKDLLSTETAGAAHRGVFLAKEPRLLCQRVHRVLPGNHAPSAPISLGVSNCYTAHSAGFPWKHVDSPRCPLSSEGRSGFPWLLRRFGEDADRYGRNRKIRRNGSAKGLEPGA